MYRAAMSSKSGVLVNIWLKIPKCNRKPKVFLFNKKIFSVLKTEPEFDTARKCCVFAYKLNCFLTENAFK